MLLLFCLVFYCISNQKVIEFSSEWVLSNELISGYRQDREQEEILVKGRSLTVSTSHQTDEEQDKVLVQVQLTASSLANELMNVISRLQTPHWKYFLKS